MRSEGHRKVRLQGVVNVDSAAERFAACCVPGKGEGRVCPALPHARRHAAAEDSTDRIPRTPQIFHSNRCLRVALEIGTD